MCTGDCKSVCECENDLVCECEIESVRVRASECVCVCMLCYVRVSTHIPRLHMHAHRVCLDSSTRLQRSMHRINMYVHVCTNTCRARAYMIT